MMDKILYNYRNGNINVTLYESGTQVLEYPDDETPQYEFPTSADCKITNYCEVGCDFCHEGSSKKGKHGDLNKLSEILSGLPGGQELAIGGGSCMDHPDFDEFLERCKQQHLVCNITINQKEFQRNRDRLIKLMDLIDRKLIYGIGLSVDADEKVVPPHELAMYPHTVIHLIIGIHTPNDLKQLRLHGFKKFLLLGYKVFGRGEKYYENNKETIDNNIQEWSDDILKLFKGCIISFDNLAIEQLGMEDKIPKKIWDQSYMGDDFNHTMYIDAVEQQFAPTSRSPKSERVNWKDVDFLEYFQKNRKK